jgi:hypothetical protein
MKGPEGLADEQGQMPLSKAMTDGPTMSFLVPLQINCSKRNWRRHFTKRSIWEVEQTPMIASRPGETIWQGRHDGGSHEK